MSTLKEAILIFDEWYQQAKEADPEYYNAMNLATVSKNLEVHSRMVLLKKHSEQGFIFYTNLGSKKAADLRENPVAALCFFGLNLKSKFVLRVP